MSKFKRQQRGSYLPDLGPVFFFAIVGLIAAAAVLFVGLPALAWWLWTTFDVVRVR